MNPHIAAVLLQERLRDLHEGPRHAHATRPRPRRARRAARRLALAITGLVAARTS